MVPKGPRKLAIVKSASQSVYEGHFCKVNSLPLPGLRFECEIGRAACQCPGMDTDRNPYRVLGTYCRARAPGRVDGDAHDISYLRPEASLA